MMKRFWVFILLFLAAGLTLAQDMPPLPPDAPASAVPAKDNGMPALPDTGVLTAPPAVAPPSIAASSDIPVLPDISGASPAASTHNTGMPPLPDTGGSNAVPAKAEAVSAPNAMPPLSDMPPLPGSGPASPNAASPANPNANVLSASHEEAKPSKPKPVHEKQPWKESKIRPNAIFGGYVKANGGNITSQLSWTSQQVLNALDAGKYKMTNEEGVYEGERNKGPQYRKFTFSVPRTEDTVIVFLKQAGDKIWLRVGPDEEPAPVNHTYAKAAKMSRESLAVLHILKAKFASRMAPHHMVPSWDAHYNHQRESADE